MAKKNDNTFYYIGGTALLLWLILKPKKPTQTPTPINVIPTNNNNNTGSGSGGDTGIVAPAPLPIVFTPPINNEPINPNIPHYNSPNYPINTGGGENNSSGGGGGDVNPYKNADDLNNGNIQVQNFLAGLKQALQD